MALRPCLGDDGGWNLVFLFVGFFAVVFGLTLFAVGHLHLGEGRGEGHIFFFGRGLGVRCGGGRSGRGTR